MKVKLETNVSRPDGQPAEAPGAAPWWKRSIAVPALALAAMLALIIVLATSTVLLSRNPQTPVQAGPTAPPSAVFLRTDTVTQGAWKRAYGFSGYAIAHDRTKFPAYASIGIPDDSHTSLWVDRVDEPRGLEKPKGTKRIAATWFGWTPFTIDIKLTDDRPHRLAAYLLDWDSVTRVENIDLLDGVSGQVLDSRHVANFSDGQYLVWRVSGHIILRVTPVSGANAVLNGLFLD